jgi:hypothetical protein
MELEFMAAFTKPMIQATIRVVGEKPEFQSTFRRAGDGHVLDLASQGVQHSLQECIEMSLSGDNSKHQPHPSASPQGGISEASVKARGLAISELTNCLSINELFVLLGYLGLAAVSQKGRSQ